MMAVANQNLVLKKIQEIIILNDTQHTSENQKLEETSDKIRQST